MAFSHGKDAVLWLNGVKLSQWLRSITMAPTVDLHDSSVFELDDKTFIAGMESSTISANGLYEGTEAAIDQILDDLLGDPPGPIFTYLPAGDGFGARMKSMVASVSTHTITTPATDLATIDLAATSNVGHESGVILAPHILYDASDESASVDNGGDTEAGAAGYLQVSAGTPADGELDVKIQHSDDDAVWVDLITFATVEDADAPTAQRVAVEGTIEQFVKAVWTLAGTGPEFNFLVGFHRK